MDESSQESTPTIHGTFKNQKENMGKAVPVTEETAKLLGDEAPVVNLHADFDQLLETRAKLQEVNILKEGEIEEKIEDIQNKEGVESTYKNAFQRIKNETNYLHEFEETALLSYVLSGFVEEEANGIKITWDTSPVKGNAHPLEKLIEMGNKRPKMKDVLVSLAHDGLLPEQIEMLKHEMIHILHYKNRLDALAQIAQLFFLWRGFIGKEELSEGHPHRTADMSAMRMSVSEFFNNFYAKDKSHPEKALYAVQAIDQLNAMGLSVPKVGAVLRAHGKWDEASGAYTGIQAVIDAKAEELGLGEGEVENLVLADKLERDIEKEKVRIIVQEEIQKATIHELQA